MAQSDTNMADQVIASLTGTMNPNIDIRKAAEEELRILEVTEDFCVHLAKITVDQSFDLGLRQLASLILKQYVDIHWCPISEKFVAPEASENAKNAVRQMLPIGLGDPQRKIRSSIAYAISAIASWDWPEKWGGLFDCLMQGLASGDPNSVHGAMRVLTEFIRDVTDLHMVKIIPVLLPQMYKIFMETELYDVRIRSRAVTIFHTCALFATEISEKKGALRAMVKQFIPNFLESFVKVLKIRDTNISDCGLKKEVLKAITLLLRRFDQEIYPHISEVLPAVWMTFTSSAELYVKREVLSSEGHDNAVDSEGEGTGFENVVYNAFDFIECMLDTKQCREIVKRSLEDLIFHLIMYMQVTEEQIQSWSENPDQFVQDEDDETFSYSIRISAQDLFLMCCKEFEQEGASSLFRAIERHVQLANNARSSNHPCWWKSYESLMLSIGSVDKLISDTIQTGNANFDVNLFVTSIVLPSIKASDYPFLVGRAIWVASRFAGMLQPDMLTHFIEYTVHGLKEDQPPAVRISAVRAACNFCDHLDQANATDKLHPYCESLLNGLVQLANQAPVETLALVLEAIAIVMRVSEEVSALHEPQISSMCMGAFLRYSSDPFIVSLCTDVIEMLAGFEACSQALLEHTMPIIANVLTGPSEKIVANLVAITLELLTVIIRGTKPPLPDLLIGNIFPSVVKSVVSSDDTSVIQHGGDCIRAFISCSPAQIMSWNDQDGVSGWHYVLRVASHMLDPSISEHSAAFIGRLVGVMIREFGPQLTQVLDQLLRAVLSKLQQAQTVTVVQSLVMIFAYLMKTEMLSTLSFLSEVPGPKGNTALEFVMSEWCDKQTMFFGHFDTKLCTMALAEIFKHTVATNDERLSKIMVKGEEIFDDKQTVRTRSRTKKEPSKWSSIPLPLKILKILILELGHALDIGDAGIRNDNEDEWEDEEEEYESGGVENGESRMSLSELLDSCTDGLTPEDYMNELESDPDVLSDPVHAIDLKDYLTGYFSQFCGSPVFKQFFAPQLNKNEVNILGKCGIH